VCIHKCALLRRLSIIKLLIKVVPAAFLHGVLWSLLTLSHAHLLADALLCYCSSSSSVDHHVDIIFAFRLTFVRIRAVYLIPQVVTTLPHPSTREECAGHHTFIQREFLCFRLKLLKLGL